jgi:sirohydrochlorin cobaltochelatase
MLSKAQSALVIVGHGSTLNPDSSAPTWDHAEEIRRRKIFAEVHCAFWKEEPSLRQVLYSVEASEVYVVPNFISEGYFTETVIPRELELQGPLTHKAHRTLKYCQPVGNHPRMTSLLLDRAKKVAPHVDPSKTTLFIVGHGTDLNENSAAAAKREVERVQQLGIYAEVKNAYMEEPPLISEWDQIASQPNVIVVPFFIADGLHSYEDIPMLLGISEQSPGALSNTDQSVFSKNPYHLRNKTLYYASSIGTEPGFADTIIDQVTEYDAKFGE